VSGKVIYFPETVNPFNTGDFQCFLDGDLHNHGVVESSSGLLPLNQPFCDETTFEAFLPRTELKQEPCEDQLLLESRVSALFGNLAFFQAYYGAEYCDTLNEWLQRPGFLIPSHYPESYLWPTLDVSELSCSNGKPPTDASNLNPAGVLAL
jgi:hypothetical protein